jgi:Helix-turn-helix domain
MNLVDIEGADRWQWEDMFISRLGPHPSTRLVLVVIRKNLNKAKGWTAWPSQETIAELTGLKERAVRTHIAKAADAGWITVRRRYNGSSILTAAIPDDLVEFIKSKPWDDDPTWERPADIAARSKRERPANIAARKHVTLSSEIQRPADIAKAPAIFAEAPAINDRATGNICQSDRHGLPPNSLENSLLNPIENPLPIVVSLTRPGVSTDPATSKRTIPDTLNPSPAIRAIRERYARSNR